MARQARIKSKTGIYHVMLKGNEGKKVFVDEEDKTRIVEILLQKKDAAKTGIYAYCVMDNHLHIVVREHEAGCGSLENLMKRLGVTYAMYFNRKYKRIGHVFQDRFRSEAIEDDAYLLSVIRYIHNNPLNAGLDLAYQWSSYNWYAENRKQLLPEMEEVLAYFAADRDRALQLFLSFHQDEDTYTYLEAAPLNSAENAEAILNLFLSMRNWDNAALKRSENRNQVAALIKDISMCGLSGRQIADLTGLNRETVRKLLLSKEPSL